uniref:Uncharacterized protein n=1 Tax=Lepeophtheirus salmonis TaxID=72036 RepID=A0A0K2VKH1_LEPSM
MDNTCLCNNKDVTCLNCNCTYYQYDEELCPSSFIDYDDTMPINPTVEQQPEYQDNPKIISGETDKLFDNESDFEIISNVNSGHGSQRISRTTDGALSPRNRTNSNAQSRVCSPERSIQPSSTATVRQLFHGVELLSSDNTPERKSNQSSYQVTTTGDLKTAILGNREDLDTLSTVSTTAIERDLEHPTFQEIKQ